MSFLLKIVEGPNKGAEAALVAGVAVTLGKSDECDIVLADSSLPDASLKIEASDDGVAIDGEVLEPYHVRTIGDTSFAVGPAARPWEKLVWPSVEKVEDVPPEEPPLAKAEEPAAVPSEKKKSHGCLVSLLLLLILGGILSGLGWYYREWLLPKVEPYRPQTKAAWCWTKDQAKFAYRWCRNQYDGWVVGNGEADPCVEAEQDPAEAIAEIALRHGLDIVESDGRLSISGNLKTRAERLAVTAEAYAVLPCVELSLSDDETLRTAVEDTLLLIGETGLRVRSVTNRVAVLDGKCADVATVMMQLTQEVPKIRQIDGIAVQQSMEMLPVDGDSEGVVAQNEPSAAAVRSASPAIMPALPVCGILTMPYPCLVTRSGARIMEGAAFGEWTVRKINADSVLLESQSGRFLWRP